MATKGQQMTGWVSDSGSDDSSSSDAITTSPLISPTSVASRVPLFGTIVPNGEASDEPNQGQNVRCPVTDLYSSNYAPKESTSLETESINTTCTLMGTDRRSSAHDTTFGGAWRLFKSTIITIRRRLFTNSLSRPYLMLILVLLIIGVSSGTYIGRQISSSTSDPIDPVQRTALPSGAEDSTTDFKRNHHPVGNDNDDGGSRRKRGKIYESDYDTEEQKVLPQHVPASHDAENSEDRNLELSPSGPGYLCPLCGLNVTSGTDLTRIGNVCDTVIVSRLLDDFSKSSHISILNPLSVKNLKIAGPIHRPWFQSLLRQFEDVQNLVINGSQLCTPHQPRMGWPVTDGHFTSVTLKNLVNFRLEHVNACPLHVVKWILGVGMPKIVNFTLDHSDLATPQNFQPIRDFLVRNNRSLSFITIANSLLCEDCVFADITFDHLVNIQVVDLPDLYCGTHEVIS